MLNKIKAALAGQVPSVATLSADVEAQLSLAANVAATAEAKVIEMSAQLEASLSNVASLSTQLSEAKSSLEKYAAVAAQAQAAEAEAVAKMLADKNEARMAQLTHAVGDVQADALFGSFGGVDDASFDVLVKSMTMNLDKESKSEMFTEIGVSAESSAESSDVNMSAMKQAIQKRKSKGTK